MSRPSTVPWDKQSSVKTVGITTGVTSSQASPALVNALFERVEQQSEVIIIIFQLTTSGQHQKRSKYLYYINMVYEIQVEILHKNMISSHVKITCYLHM